MSFKKLDKQDISISSNLVTAPCWSDGVDTLQNFFTLDTQLANASGEYHYNIYNYEASSSRASIQFSTAFGSLNGSGSLLFNSGIKDKSPTAAIYRQVNNLINPNSNIKFANVSGSHIYSISVERIRSKGKLVPSSLTLTLKNGTNSVTLTDDSNYQLTDNHTDVGRVYELISGSQGVAYTGLQPQGYTLTAGSYGKLLPDIGLLILNGAALDLNKANGGISLATNLNSNVDGQNNLKLFNALNEGKHFTLKGENQVSSNIIFVRARNSEFNYSLNPTNITGSGELRHDVMIETPQAYVTSVGLYNDERDLLGVAKLSRPLKKDFTKEMLVRVKMDFVGTRTEPEVDPRNGLVIWSFPSPSPSPTPSTTPSPTRTPTPSVTPTPSQTPIPSGPPIPPPPPAAVYGLYSVSSPTQSVPAIMRTTDYFNTWTIANLITGEIPSSTIRNQYTVSPVSQPAWVLTTTYPGVGGGTHYWRTTDNTGPARTGTITFTDQNGVQVSQTINQAGTEPPGASPAPIPSPTPTPSTSVVCGTGLAVSISGPSSLAVGATGTYTANVTGNHPGGTIDYNWTATNARLEILSGAGTSSVTVRNNGGSTIFQQSVSVSLVDIKSPCPLQFANTTYNVETTTTSTAATCRQVTYDTSVGLDMNDYGIYYTDAAGTSQAVSFNSLGFAQENGALFTYTICASYVDSHIWSSNTNEAFPQYDYAISNTNLGTLCTSQFDC